MVISHPPPPPQVAVGKRGDLKTLGRKVHPMEDLFHQFQAWLESTNLTLDKLSPAATDQAEREEQLKQAKVISRCAVLLLCMS